jgi:hypothetical protein
MSPALSVTAIVYFLVMVLSFISFLVSPFIAWHKGYAPYFWLFACGPIGLAVISCFPSAKTATTPEQLELMQSRANTTGAILSGIVFFLIAALVPTWLIGS